MGINVVRIIERWEENSTDRLYTTLISIFILIYLIINEKIQGLDNTKQTYRIVRIQKDDIDR